MYGTIMAYGTMMRTKLTRRLFDRMHSFMHNHSLVSNLDRPLVSGSSAFEGYIDYFHHNCHETEHGVTWRGRKAKKFPMDAWIYQEILHEIQPDVVIEIGNLNGGSTLFLANMLDLQNKGKVLAIDVDHSKIDFSHPRITWITGDANSPEIISKVEAMISPGDKVLVIEDSSHTYDNTLAVLRHYNRFVSLGSYFVVEDGVCKYEFIDGPKPGPFEAVHEFLKENPDFQIDKSKEKFALTYNPDGYLKKVR